MYYKAFQLGKFRQYRSALVVHVVVVHVAVDLHVRREPRTGTSGSSSGFRTFSHCFLTCVGWGLGLLFLDAKSNRVGSRWIVSKAIVIEPYIPSIRNSHGLFVQQPIASTTLGVTHEPHLFGFVVELSGDEHLARERNTIHPNTLRCEISGFLSYHSS